MQKRVLLKRNAGFSLVQSLIGVAILGLMASIFASLSVSQQKQIKHIERKQDVIELRSYLTLVLQQADICSCQVNPALTMDDSNDANLHFNSTITDGSQSISFSKLRTGCAVDSPILTEVDAKLPSGLQVKDIQLRNLRPLNGSTTDWIGEWNISFAENSTAITLKPITIMQKLRLEMALPSTPTNRLINTCTGMQGTGVHHVASQSGAIGVNPLGTLVIDLATYGFEDTLPDPHIIVSMNDGNYDFYDQNTVDAYQCGFTKLSKLRFQVICWTSTNSSPAANRSSFDWMAVQ
ncbi:type II secretion system protein [Bdellovibrio sp. HCB337]|uniref:type II secretion system protein n=1 Tax=Bdellovibrio sp. HCB337 TaxID=3394358 RepID=UPI0039A6054D